MNAEADDAASPSAQANTSARANVSAMRVMNVEAEPTERAWDAVRQSHSSAEAATAVACASAVASAHASAVAETEAQAKAVPVDTQEAWVEVRAVARAEPESNAALAAVATRPSKSGRQNSVNTLVTAVTWASSNAAEALELDWMRQLAEGPEDVRRARAGAGALPRRGGGFERGGIGERGGICEREVTLGREAGFRRPPLRPSFPSFPSLPSLPSSPSLPSLPVFREVREIEDDPPRRTVTVVRPRTLDEQPLPVQELPPRLEVLLRRVAISRPRPGADPAAAAATAASAARAAPASSMVSVVAEFILQTMRLWVFVRRGAGGGGQGGKAALLRGGRRGK